MANRKTITNNKNFATLSHSLVLCRFIFKRLTTVRNIGGMNELLGDPHLEGYDEKGESHFYHAMIDNMLISPDMPREKLLEYDENIRRHTEHINVNRSEKIQWKYFQWLSLIFTEYYLDRYFNGRKQLLDDLNSYLTNNFNKEAENYHGIEPFVPEELNKLAFWNATGSGKTLLMHVNILQYLHYLNHSDKHKNSFNRIILLTPNEGLTAQHLEELKLSSIDASNFSKGNGTMFNGRLVEVLETTKLADEDGDKTVAVDAFEKGNLVLVDEGHKGSGGDVWKRMRDRLSEDGFSFEYSATFGQSIGAVSGKKKNALLQEYAKATLFDYSYKHFYNDGYGKDYSILNLSKTWDDGQQRLYLTACLLSFYEQILLFNTQEKAIRPFLISKPLAVFVGSSVTASVSDRDASDVVTILNFFSHFIDDSRESIDFIARILDGRDGLVDDKTNSSIFSHSFEFLRKQKTAQEIYSDMLGHIFNSTVAGANLIVDDLKGQKGEIGMRVGNAEYFGVINVGDSSALIKKLEKHHIHTNSKDFGDRSLFAAINTEDSRINVLIGSRKFTEGWSSWRVSTMGLMNIGVNEGSQIIQLFGRGVRLKGFGMSLKRSKKLTDYDNVPDIPQYLYLLETLNIFGIHADYMERFKEYLEEEGIKTDNKDDYEEIVLDTMLTVNFPKLKYLRLKVGKDFKNEFPHLQLQFDIHVPAVTLNYYPRIQMMNSGGQSMSATANTGTLHEEKIQQEYLDFINWDDVYFALQEYKRARRWNNLSFSKSILRDIMRDTSWYCLQIPAEDIKPHNFPETVSLWQTLTISLLRLYVESFYEWEKGKWTSENLISDYLREDDPNFIEQYKLLVKNDLQDVTQKLHTLLAELKGKKFHITEKLDGVSEDFKAIFFSPHLYQPLMYLNGKPYETVEGQSIIVQPVALVQSEHDFIMSLIQYLSSDSGKEFMKGKSIYLLRNQSRKGLGINDVYPDFILWIISGQHQYVTFVEPHGLEHEKGVNSPKVSLWKFIRQEVQPKLNDPDITLNSFVISPTAFKQLKLWGETIPQLNQQHIFFQKDQQNYIEQMMKDIVGQV